MCGELQRAVSANITPSTAIHMDENHNAEEQRQSSSFLRRARWHDYTSRCIYLVTFSAAKGAPAFSAVRGEITPDGVKAETDLFPVGAIIDRELNRIPEYYPFVNILAYSVMPDHVHVVLFVEKANAMPLPRVVAAVKARCTGAYREAFPESSLTLAGESLFTKGFNDRIVSKSGQAEAFCRYVNDNPKRLYLRKNHPEFFNRCRLISVNGRQLAAYGNLLLLRHCAKSVVKVSRSFSAEETAAAERVWSEAIRSHGVLVSPFISEGEKAVRNLAVDNSASIIHILPNGFPERFKPSGREFVLCQEGRLLLIAPVEFRSRRFIVSREQCLEMNELAELIASDRLAFNIRRNGKPI